MFNLKLFQLSFKSHHIIFHTSQLADFITVDISSVELTLKYNPKS